MANLQGCFSHKSDHWKTPTDIYNSFINQGFIDPCPYMADFNGLERIYVDKKIFCNPPYSDIVTWVDYLLNLYDNYHCDFALLVPSRTDTKWFHKLLRRGFYLFFFEGRLHFNDSKSGAPFPSCIISSFEMKDKLFKKGDVKHGKKTKKSHEPKERPQGFLSLCCGRKESQCDS